MNIRTIRFLDHYVGIALCFVLSLIKPLLRKSQSNKNSVLLIELSEMGSAILLSPIIAQIKTDYPNAEVSFLIFRRHQESVEICGIVDRVITLDDSSILNLVLSLPKVIAELRKLKIYYLLDCELFSRISTIIAALSGAENISGFVAPKVRSLYRGSLYTHPFAYNNLTHITENYLGLWKVFFSARLDLPYIKEQLKVDRSLIKFIEIAEEKRLKTISSKAVIFNPDPGQISLRGWPIESYIALGRLLIKNHNCQIILIGAESARPLAERCRKEFGEHCLDLAGKTESLMDLLAVYSSSCVLVTADSGPAHLAALVRLPTIVLFGPESAIRFAPVGENINTLSAELACSPCLSAFNLRESVCRNNLCMKEISVDMVYKRVCEFL